MTRQSARAGFGTPEDGMEVEEEADSGETTVHLNLSVEPVAAQRVGRADGRGRLSRAIYQFGSPGQV